MENHKKFVGSEYNQRQFRQMRWALENYEKDQTSLGRMISRLEGLLDCLEETEPMWAKAFNHYVAMLEEVHAVALDEVETQGTKPVFDQQAIGLIKKAIAGLKLLIKSVLWKTG